ncbi:right-handed parallel beta-helix repeat-containing protein [Silvibacterium dinghuense]|nr:right-handed parallel beta-helix repeat-containing protein [Silvibacterium dinghuense]GGH00496.1 hypothetical protein GCM10011586_15090 [Silvibacterium dinghuense]
MSRLPLHIIRPTLLCSALLCGAGAAHAATYYISSSGSDTNSGLRKNDAWKTLDQVNRHVFAPGDRILFHRGDAWSGQLTPQGSGAEGHPVILDTYGSGPEPIIHGPGTDHSSAVDLKDLSYWEIHHLELTNSQPAGGTHVLRGILVESSSQKNLEHHIYIRDCYVHDVNSVGYGDPHYTKISGGILYDVNIDDARVENCHVARVTVEGIRNNSPLTTSRVIFRNNEIEDVYGDGIVLHGSSGGSIIEHNRVRNACMSDAANYAAVWTYASRHTLIQFNEVYGTTAGGPNDGEAFDADIDTDGDIFQYNYTHDNARGFMLFMSSAKNIVVRYNISQNDAMMAARQGGHRLFYQDGKTGSLSNRIYNNTFYTGSLDTVFFQSRNIDFRNNILYSTGEVKQLSTLPVNADSQIERNLFFPAITPAKSDQESIAGHNLAADPRFRAGGAGKANAHSGKAGFFRDPKEYRLKRGSPALRAGQVIEQNGGFDYFGKSLPAQQAPNLGAAN